MAKFDDDDERSEPRPKQTSGFAYFAMAMAAVALPLVLSGAYAAFALVTAPPKPAPVPAPVFFNPPPAPFGAPKQNNVPVPKSSEFSEPEMIEDGVMFQEAVLKSGTIPMKVWYYQPEKPQGKLALVLVPPAGSTLVSGMGLNDGDREEHFPYVRAGFAVASFEIDGQVADDASDAMIFKAAREFRDSKAGINNAKAALDFILAKCPDVDPDRVFIAGHSSAATLALLVASHDARIKGCISYCGCTDVEERLAKAIPDLNRAIPGYRDFIRFSSPKTHVDKLTCPTFLFHASDDDNVPTSQTITFAALLKKTNKEVTVDVSAKGGHYDSMIKSGIPKGIAWLKKR
jgi:dipeptidyl aminopeptidase/acylaminoacyl peptidase